MVAGNFTHLYVLIFALIFALIGFIDDYKKLKREQNLGLRARHKFILQLLVAVAFIFFMEFTGNLTTNLYIPFINKTVYIPMALYNIFAAFVIVGTVNSVNITDGADGLVTGVTIPVMIFFTVIAFLWNAPENSVIAAAAVGGLAAFLFFNFYPAKVFMGDTGSLFLGGLVCAMAFALDIPLLLITLGFVYFVETASDIIQVTYFKLTKGKRVFKMAPIHHHFEMCGWSEYKLFTIFTTVSAVFVIISYFGVFRRYL
jgi:phospho-N-acetylmuramoyl-pentapeptide-transferase